MVAPLILAGLGAAAGGIAQIFGAKSAAKAQLTAADKANALQLAMFAKGQKNLKPFIQAGKSATNDIVTKKGGVRDEWNTEYSLPGLDTRANELYRLGTQGIQFGALDTGADQIRSLGTTAIPFQGLNSGGNELINIAGMAPEFNPINMTQEQLAATPGYQFTLNQGLKAVQNSAAARGLGSSGMALRGAADYTTGLADTTWQNVYAQLAAEREARYQAGATDLERMMSGLERGYALQSGERGAQFAASAANRDAAIQSIAQAYGLQAGERAAQFQAAATNRAAAMSAITDAYNLANTERTTQFNAYQTDIQNRYNRLYQAAALGQGAAVGAGTIGATTGGQLGQTTVGAGNASAGAYMAGANALSNMFSDIGGYAFLGGTNDNGSNNLFKYAA